MDFSCRVRFPHDPEFSDMSQVRLKVWPTVNGIILGREFLLSSGNLLIGGTGNGNWTFGSVAFLLRVAGLGVILVGTSGLSSARFVLSLSTLGSDHLLQKAPQPEAMTVSWHGTDRPGGDPVGIL